MKLIANNKELGKIYEPRDVFEACLKQGLTINKNNVDQYMYMYSNDEKTHYFKHIITRQYVTVTL